MRGCSPPKHRVPSGSQLPDIETAQPRDLVVEQVSVRHRRIDYHARHGAQAARWRDRREAERAPPESTMRYTRSPSTFSERSSRPSFLRTTPAKKPRTECCCQWVARMMAAMVAPSGRASIASTRACFEPDRLSRSEPVLVFVLPGRCFLRAGRCAATEVGLREATALGAGVSTSRAGVGLALVSLRSGRRFDSDRFEAGLGDAKCHRSAV